MYDFDIKKLWKDHIQYDDYVSANLDRREEIKKFIERCVGPIEDLLIPEIENEAKEKYEENHRQDLDQEYDRGKGDGKYDVAVVLKQMIKGDSDIESIKSYIGRL